MGKLLLAAAVLSTLYGGSPSTTQSTTQLVAFHAPQTPINAPGMTSTMAFALARTDSDANPIPLKTQKVWVTAYSSSPDETDDTPFITASGHHVRDGIIATNILPFGTRVIIPAISEDKIFVVDDRMNERFSNNVDIWMPSKSEARRFGIMQADIEILP